ncbi:MAG: hypothetical protein M5U29_07470 [Anaerolineae bacterium]|nr:hypothetical protein [Anaerolineae bacterium]
MDETRGLNDMLMDYWKQSSQLIFQGLGNQAIEVEAHELSMLCHLAARGFLELKRGLEEIEDRPQPGPLGLDGETERK